MRNGIAISGLLHATIAVIALLGLPNLMSPPVIREQPILVQLVTIAEKTVSQKPRLPKPIKNPAPVPTLKPVPKAEAEPELVKREIPKVIKKAKKQKPAFPKKIVASPPKPDLKPRINSPKAIKLKTRKQTKALPPAPRPKLKPKQKQRKFNANRIAALLDKNQPKIKSIPQVKKIQVKDPEKVSQKSFAPSLPMTMSEIDAIRYQIRQCWTIPAGARDAENLVIRIQIFLNMDGSLSKRPKIVGSNQTGNAYRTAAESAVRAVLKCQPLKHLPAAKYSNWREITLKFNPRQMLGGGTNNKTRN